MKPAVVRIDTSKTVWMLVTGFDQVDRVELLFRPLKVDALPVVVPACFDKAVDEAEREGWILPLEVMGEDWMADNTNRPPIQDQADLASFEIQLGIDVDARHPESREWLKARVCGVDAGSGLGSQSGVGAIGFIRVPKAKSHVQKWHTSVSQTAQTSWTSNLLP